MVLVISISPQLNFTSLRFWVQISLSKCGVIRTQISLFLRFNHIFLSLYLSLSLSLSSHSPFLSNYDSSYHTINQLPRIKGVAQFSLYKKTSHIISLELHSLSSFYFGIKIPNMGRRQIVFFHSLTVCPITLQFRLVKTNLLSS